MIFWIPLHHDLEAALHELRRVLKGQPFDPAKATDVLKLYQVDPTPETIALMQEKL